MKSIHSLIYFSEAFLLSSVSLHTSVHNLSCVFFGEKHETPHYHTPDFKKSSILYIASQVVCICYEINHLKALANSSINAYAIAIVDC